MYVHCLSATTAAGTYRHTRVFELIDRKRGIPVWGGGLTTVHGKLECASLGQLLSADLKVLAKGLALISAVTLDRFLLGVAVHWVVLVQV